MKKVNLWPLSGTEKDQPKKLHDFSSPRKTACKIPWNLENIR